MAFKETHFIYFLLDGGSVVYIGCSMSLPGRMQVHKYEKPHTSVRLMGPYSRKFAFKNEARWIKRFRPIYNKVVTKTKNRAKVDPQEKVILVGFYIKKNFVDMAGGMNTVRELAKEYIESVAKI